MFCENCRVEHDGEYGSGRFCSKYCAHSFVSKQNRKEKNLKIGQSLKGRVSVCIGIPKTESCKLKLSVALKRYFSEHPENIERIKLTNIGRVKTDKEIENIKKGVKGKTGGYRPGSGRGKHGWYKGYWCDSSWELAWVIYNLEHNVIFKRNTKKFDYFFNNRNRKWIPDFILENGTYVEIKGYMNKQNESKISYFKEKLSLITKKEIELILNYVIKKYGNHYTELYGS